MSKRNYCQFLDDIVTSSAKILKYIKNKTFADFAQDDMRVDAVVRNLEIIGEAVKHMPENIKTRYKSVEWQKIAGLRDILAHEYFGIDKSILWDIANNKLPALNKQAKLILKEIKLD